MDGSFIRELVNQTAPRVEVFNGVEYSDKSFEAIMPPVPQPLVAHSLSAIADYCREELDPEETYVIHIKGPGEVSLLSRLMSPHRYREQLLYSRLIHEPFRFGEKYPVEQFVIAMQAQFVQDDTTAAILSLVGNITAEAKQITEDDGVTQRVTAKAGIARVEEREVPNPVLLKPFRTFQEVEQPASKFVLRVNASGPTCALYEADGGAWKNKAITSIKIWFDSELRKLIDSGVVTVIG